MKINYDNCKSVLNTLPISLYLGRDGVIVDMDEKGKDSYYDPMEDKIVISYPCVSQMLSYVKSTKELDGIIRGILYHEISHALLTPEGFMRGYKAPELDALNVFEDERIETVLHDFYYGVDFKRNIILLNNYHGEAPQDAFSAFYHTVRYRHGKPHHLARVNQIIENFWSVTQDNNRMCDTYESHILRLYYDIAKEWLEENNPEALEQEAKKMKGMGEGEEGESSESGGTGKSAKPTYDSMLSSQKDEVVKRVLQKEQETGESPVLVGVGNGDPTDGESADDKEYVGGRWHIPDYSDEAISKDEIKKIEVASYNATEFLDKTKIQQMLNTMMNHFIDGKLTNDIAMIFENFMSRNKNNSAALPRYSGVMNPRAFARDDWRIFEYKSTSGPVKGYDKLHINLFIDTSGSYYNNEERTNTILKSLIDLEQKYPFFYFDLVTMQRTVTLRNKNERYIQATGGNDFDEKGPELYKQLQDPRSFNYNIVLFDGDAWTDTPRHKVEAHKRYMSTFNNSKTSIISDKDNKVAIETYAPLSHHIIVDNTSHKSYSELLYDNILAVLTRALL